MRGPEARARALHQHVLVQIARRWLRQDQLLQLATVHHQGLPADQRGEQQQKVVLWGSEGIIICGQAPRR